MTNGRYDSVEMQSRNLMLDCSGWRCCGPNYWSESRRDRMDYRCCCWQHFFHRCSDCCSWMRRAAGMAIRQEIHPPTPLSKDYASFRFNSFQFFSISILAWNSKHSLFRQKVEDSSFLCLRLVLMLLRLFLSLWIYRSKWKFYETIDSFVAVFFLRLSSWRRTRGSTPTSQQENVHKHTLFSNTGQLL